MRRQKSVYQGWKRTSGLLGYLDIIRCLVGPCGGVCDDFRSVPTRNYMVMFFSGLIAALRVVLNLSKFSIL